MAAAAEFLEQHLHVHVAEAAGRNIRLIARAENHERRADVLDREQLVGCLRRRDADIRKLPVRAGDRAALVDLRARDKLRALLVGVERIREHLLDLHRIGAAPLQVGRGLEGAHAGFEDKVLRIEHDAGEQRRGLALVERGAVDVLHKLGHHLGGGARIRLVVKDDRVLNVRHDHAVVVDHDDARDRL